MNTVIIMKYELFNFSEFIIQKQFTFKGIIFTPFYR